jgi:glutamate-1-semialdehyde 2,1-aminomutase
MNTKSARRQSEQAYQEACRYLPGGVNSPVRAYRGVDTGPVFIASGQGSHIVDIDGNHYIDYVGSWGPLIAGHAHPTIVDKVNRALMNGTSFGAPTLAETLLARRIQQAFASIEQVRMVNSGTEAVMAAVRLARAYTHRDLIIKMAGCYHGHSDSLLVQAGSGLAEHGSPSSRGVPVDLARLTVVVPYNDTRALQTVLQQHTGQVAAVLLEPVAANMGVVPPNEGYLEAVRGLCSDAGVLLIFDEVISGFRVAFGGAQQLYGVAADITCLGKIIGGGLPVGAVGGPEAVMCMLAPEGPVYQAGTLSGNPLAVAAAHATLDILEQEGQYEQLEMRSAALESGFIEAARDTGIALHINRVGSMLSCFFTDQPVCCFTHVQDTDIQRFKRYFLYMLDQGIYLAPSAFEAMFVSLAHSTEDIRQTIDAARHSLEQVRKC